MPRSANLVSASGISSERLGGLGHSHPHEVGGAQRRARRLFSTVSDFVFVFSLGGPTPSEAAGGRPLTQRSKTLGPARRRIARDPPGAVNSPSTPRTQPLRAEARRRRSMYLFILAPQGHTLSVTHRHFTDHSETTATNSRQRSKHRTPTPHHKSAHKSHKGPTTRIGEERAAAESRGKRCPRSITRRLPACEQRPLRGAEASVQRG